MTQIGDALSRSDNSPHINTAIPQVSTTPLHSTTRETNMRRKYLSLDLELKKKKKKNKYHQSYNKSTVEIGNESLNRLSNSNWKRVDAYGIPITKHKPKQKVTFIDSLQPNKQLFIQEYIESYKEYNIAMSYPDINKEILAKRTICCSLSSSSTSASLSSCSIY